MDSSCRSCSYLCPASPPACARLQSCGPPRYLSEVHTAHNRDARWLRTRLRELCKAFGTRVLDGPGERLTIPLQGSLDQGGAEGTAAGSGGTDGGSSGRRSLHTRLLGLEP